MLNNTINYDELDAEFGITPTIENKSVNNIALSNVQTLEPEYEQDYNDAYSTPSWFDNLNVYSEDEIKQWQAMGPMGIAEAWERNNKWQAFVPYINTTKDAAEAVNASVLLKRLKDGKELNEKQMDLLVDYLRDVKEQQVRGYSFAGGVVNGTLESIPYLEEFAIGLATSEAGVGLASLAKTITTIGAKKAAKKAVQKAMQEAAVQSTMTGVKKNLTKQQIKSIYDDAILKTTTSKAIAEVGAKTFAKETLKATPQALLSSAKIGLTKMPQNFVGNIADRQLAGGIYVTDAGQGVFTNSENIALSFMKALGDTTFEALSETAGFMFAPINKFFAKPIRNVLPKKFYTEFDKLVSSRYGMKTTEALKKYGYDGILEEMGEEQLNRFLTNVFGSNGVQGYTLDGFLNNVFYFDREGKEGLEGFKTGALNAAESYASEALSFAAISGGARGAIGGTSKLAEKWNEKRLQNEYKKLANYSLNEFYLDQGLIKIKGSQSSTEAALRHRANAMGIDSATIDEYCKLSSENEMRAKLQELILDDNAKIDVEALRKEQEAVEKLRENYFNQLKAAGADDVVANETATFYALGFAKLAKENGKSINEIPETNIIFQNLTEDEAVKQYNQGFNQVPQDVEPKFQAAASAGANENEVAEAEKEYAEKGTESKYFKKWFGDSKVVDIFGNPISVFHGTENNFKIFKNLGKSRQIGANVGFFFTDSKNMAKQYADDKRVMEVYLSLQNPLIVEPNSVVEIFNEKIEITDTFDFFTQLDTKKSEQEIKEELLKQGYDGIILRNTNVDTRSIEDVHDVYIAFEPEQIKSVNNRGTFDANNPNIFYQQDMYSAGNDIIEKSRNALSKLLEKFSNKPEANITVGDVFEQIPMFEPIKDFFNGIEDVKIVLEKNRETVNGRYNYKTDTLYLNEKSFYAKNIPASRIRTLLHELTHAHQKRLYDKFKYEIANVSLTESEKKEKQKYIDGYEESIDANKAYQKYRKQHKKDIQKYYKLKRKGLLDKKENQKYVEIYNEKQELYNNYETSFAEVKAEELADRLLDVLGLRVKYENEKYEAERHLRGNGHDVQHRRIYPERYDEGGLYSRRSGNGTSFDERRSTQKSQINNILFQSAWHGGAVNFDKFDLGYALSGEGAMVHGYGVYLAQNRDVSEKYRKMLSSIEVYYDNKRIGYSDDVKLFFYIRDNGKKQTLKDFNKYKELEEKRYNLSLEYNELGNEGDKIDYTDSKFEEFYDRYSKKEIELQKSQKALSEFLEEKSLPLPEVRYDLETLIKKIKSIDVKKIKFAEGQLYEVDIPENDVLLDEDKPFNEQPPKVRNALIDIAKETSNPSLNSYIVMNGNGKGLYKAIGYTSNEENADKYASLKLNEYGIKGITYDGRQDGRCYVIFDDKAVDIIKKYYQGLDEDSNEANTEESIRNAKGFFYEKKAFDGTPKENIVVLIKNKADASTLIHEFAHIYLQTLNNLARTSDKAKQQLLTVNKWLRYDGKEYTTAQHEKFADGFVAYVKSGKAPSYGLKRVFENFRRWLSDISNKIFTTEDIEIDPDVKKVFDELLGDLSVNQQEKLSEEIITKARDNAELRMRDELVEKGNVKFNELTDKQRRYRDTAYDIIFYALKHSKNEETRNYVQNISDLRMKLGSGNTKSLQRQFERIELLLAETDDAFSAHDGFLPEWGEFFNDTGVSYDNLQQGADAELALNAFEVIRDKKYLYDESFEELSENDIKKAQYELEYIINEYKYAEDKSVPMSAFFTWIDSQHSYIQDELLKQWENETNEIDRYQALSKFEQAKEDLMIKAAQMQGLGDYSMQFAEYARAIIKRLDFMTEKDKARIFDKLKDFNSFKEVQANLDDVMDFAQTLYNVTERRKIADDILREVKGTIHEWKDGIKRTKYTYPANKLFARLRELNNLPLEDIKDLYDAQVNEEIKPTYEADAVNTDDYYETIEKMFIEFKANGVYYNSTAFLQDLLTRVQNAKFTAKVARDEMDFERRMQAINLVDEAAKAVSKHKGKASKLEQVYRYGFNLNNALEMMFDKNIKSKFSLDYLYAQKDAKVGADRDVVLNKLKENFGFKGVMADTFLFNKFIDMTKKEFKITQRYSPDIAQGVIRETHRDKETGKQFTDKKINYAKDAERSEWQPEEIELSRMEVLYYYIQSLNEDSYKILTDMGSKTQAPKGQFDKYEFDEMINQLTEQEKMMGLILQQAAEKYYDELNRYHIKKYHTELGKVKNYFPRKTELTEVKPLELFSDYANYSGVLSAQKQRTANAGARIAPANALAVLFQHMEKANTLIVMGEQLDLMNRVFKDQSLKKKVEIVWGIDTAKEFYNQIAGNLYSGQASMLSDAENLIGRIENNVIKAQIFAKAQVGLKQIISFLNYGTGDEYVSTAEWNAAFWKQSFTPKEWKNNIDYMMNIPYLKDRFGRGGSTDALKRQLEQRMFAKMSLLDDFFSLPIKVGDMGAIILGGKPYIDALINKGYTEEQALKIFIEKTVNEMQSSIPSTMSNLQRNAAKQPLAKMFFAYQNTPWQYFRVAAMSMIQFKQNPNVQTGLNMAKLTGLYMFVFPLIFNLASSLSLVTGDEDELQNDIWKSVIGGVTFVPLAGMFINAMLSGFLGERVSTGNWFDTAAAKTGNIARKMAKGDDITAVDLLKALALFGEAGTGLPLTSIGTEVAGVYDVATGAPAKGILKVAGYSDYRAKKISGEED